MEKFEDASSVKATSDFMAEMMMDEKDGEEFTREYLKTRFLSSVGRSLYYARRKADLTQAQVAERMNTTQSVIARYEADKKGSITFHRYVDFAIACGLMPRSLTLHPILEPVESLRDEVIANVALQQSQVAPTQIAPSFAFYVSSEPVPVSFPSTVQVFTTQSAHHDFPLATLLTLGQEVTPTANSANQFLAKLRCMQEQGANLALAANSVQSTV